LVLNFNSFLLKGDDFVKLITEGYTYKGELILGAAILAGETLGNASVKIPLKP
jgi:hypothetical protein